MRSRDRCLSSTTLTPSKCHYPGKLLNALDHRENREIDEKSSVWVSVPAIFGGEINKMHQSHSFQWSVNLALRFYTEPFYSVKWSHPHRNNLISCIMYRTLYALQNDNNVQSSKKAFPHGIFAWESNGFSTFLPWRISWRIWYAEPVVGFIVYEAELLPS